MNPEFEKQHEAYTKFFENPSRESFRELVKSDAGETDDVDFKREWPKLARVAKTVLAMANSGGGVIVFGVEELTDKTRNPCGIPKLRDPAEVAQGIDGFLPSCTDYKLEDFHYKESDYANLKGKKFQVLMVCSRPEELPYVSTGSGDGIRQSTIYVRNKTRSIEASHEALQKIIEARIESGYSSGRIKSLRQHLGELEILSDYLNNGTPVLRGLVHSSLVSRIVSELLRQKQQTLSHLLK